MVVMNNYLSNSGHVNWANVLTELLLFLILPPVIGLPFIIYKIWNKQNTTKTQYLVFFFCIATYFAAINATKMPDGDQFQYYYAYKNVPKQGFIGSLINIYGITYNWQEERTHISGEFMNGIYNYVGYYLTFGYYPLFAAILTFVDYILIFLGLYKFCQTLKKPHIPIVCGVLILSFFYLFFNYTLHIQKQFLAQAIVTYVLGNYALTGKMTRRLWIITTFAVFTHAAVWIFVPFLLLKRLHTRLTKNGLIIIGGLFVSSIIFGPQLAGSVVSSGESSVLTYGASRLAKSEVNNDTEFGLVWSQVLVIAIPMAIITLRKLWLERRTLNDTNAFILNIVLLLLLTVVAMYKQPLAQCRYFMMLFAFMPFIYPFVSNNISIRNTFLKYLSGIMTVWFYFQFEKIIWHYAPELHIIGVPPIGLIFSNYPEL